MKRPSKLITLFSLFVVAVMFLFSSCNKDDNGKPSDKDGTLEIAPFELSGQMKKLVYYSSMTGEIDPYYAFEYFDLGSGAVKLNSLGNLLAEGTVSSNGDVSISFLTSFPTADLHLHRFLYHAGESDLISPKDLCTSYLYVVSGLGTEFIPNSGGAHYVVLEKLPCLAEGLGDFYRTEYAVICAEEPGEIKGVDDSGIEYDMTLKKGWNIVRISSTGDAEDTKYETVDNIPADAFFRYGAVTVDL